MAVFTQEYALLRFLCYGVPRITETFHAKSKQFFRRILMMEIECSSVASVATNFTLPTKDFY